MIKRQRIGSSSLYRAHQEIDDAVDLAFLAMKSLAKTKSFLKRVKHDLDKAPVIPTPPLNKDLLLKDPVPGTLLVSHPLLTDPFERTVILMLSYSKTSGAKGVIVNQPFTGSSIELSEGGPLKDTSVLLHTKPDMSNTITIFDGLYCRMAPTESDLQVVKEWVQAKESSKVTQTGSNLEQNDSLHPHHAPVSPASLLRKYNLYHGYSVWYAGQLEKELSQGSWFVTKMSDINFIFQKPTTKGSTPPGHPKMETNENVWSFFFEINWRGICEASGNT